MPFLSLLGISMVKAFCSVKDNLLRLLLHLPQTHKQHLSATVRDMAAWTIPLVNRCNFPSYTSPMIGDLHGFATLPRLLMKVSINVHGNTWKHCIKHGNQTWHHMAISKWR